MMQVPGQSLHERSAQLVTEIPRTKIEAIKAILRSATFLITLAPIQKSASALF
jgi:hypothetical protein